ncbi:alkaline phosphatase D family protein [Patulibacter sp. NPDC049589]|uniref:alkaline phosphatase D family protein n=1 Tax=Patulibacter sp. NPDC049589 TaxID=3154731 RepID=UPI00342920CD
MTRISITRRELVVAGGTLAAGLALTTPAHARLLPTTRGVGRGRFLDGVASGEPSSDAVTFWGRLTTSAPRSAARLIVAEDQGLTKTVATVVVPTSAGVDHTLKARVGGLKPAQHYWYAWQSSTDVSPVGRTKTAPPGDSDTPISIAYSSCQNYGAGFFSAHADAAAHDEIDLCAFLGDYTYEYAYGDYGGQGRGSGVVDPASTDLTSYREKLRLYRADAPLRELHRLHPVVHVWDDHEIADNYTDGAPAPSDLQRNAGYRASTEWLPRLAFPGDRFRLYRSLRYGRNAELFITDQRQYRTAGDPGTTMLGRPQLDWLKRGIQASSARFKLVGNPDMIAPLGLAPLGATLATINSDQWDGYPAERAELLNHIAANAIGDVVFLTGDIHLYMANDLLLNGRSVATEYIGGSVTSPGLPALLNALGTPAIRALNTHIRFFDGEAHGWALARVTKDALTVDFRVNDITVKDAPSRTLASFVQPVGANQVQQQAVPTASRDRATPAPATSRSRPLALRQRRLETVADRDLARRVALAESAARRRRRRRVPAKRRAV